MQAHSFHYNGGLGGTRTPDTQVRSLVLYPTELRARSAPILAWAAVGVKPVITVTELSPRADTARQIC